MLSVYYLEYTPIKDLKLKVNAGVDRKYRKRSTYLPKTTLYGNNSNGDASMNQYDNRDYLIETTANYNKQISKHKVNILAGHSYQIFNGEGFSAGNKDFVTDSYLYSNLGAGEYSKPTVGSWSNKSTMASFFGRVNYSYLQRYLLTVTMRADGASNLAQGHQWGYFPSVATAWRFSDEPYMEKFKKILSNGKLRISYGETGNSNIGNGAIDYYKSSVEYVFGENAYRGVELGQVGNKNLTWETTKEWNFGLDLGISDRINISAEYFDRQIVNLLSKRDLMSYFPIATLADNIGTTQSHGYELTINSQNIIKKNFTWSTIFTYSSYRDTWKKRADSWKPASYEGYNDPIRSAYGYLSDGLIQADEVIAHMPGSLPGQVKITDIDSYRRDDLGNIIVDDSGIPLKTGMPDGKLDDADKVFYGSYDPEFMIGFSNSFKHKNWDMSIYFYGVFNQLSKASYYDNWALGASNLLNDHNVPVSVKDVWSSINTTSKRPGYTQMLSQYGIGDYYLKKISFVRLRNITIGYNLPLKKIISNLRCYVDINSAILFTNYNGLDPETDNIDVAYPNVRTFSLGLDITF
jgi:TonB-linked SusC/RagA family outer membrane protein